MVFIEFHEQTFGKVEIVVVLKFSNLVLKKCWKWFWKICWNPVRIINFAMTSLHWIGEKASLPANYHKSFLKWLLSPSLARV